MTKLSFPSLCLCLAILPLLALAMLRLAGTAHAQPEPTLIIPPSGPCDATLPVRGSGFEPTRGPTTILRLYLLQPGSADISSGILNPAFVDQDGAFSAWAPLYEHGCEAAALDSKAEQPIGHLVIAAAGSSSGEPVVAPGERIPDIIAVAQYAYTTTTPRVPTETMTISPSSGPCDATVEVRGQGFPPSTAIRLDMGAPQSDRMMGKLASLTTDPSGRFVTKVELGSLGCTAAAIDDNDSGQLWLFADLEEPVIEPQGVPSSLARAPYRYTTTHVALQPLPDALAGTGSGPEPRPSPLTPLPLAGLLAALGIVLLVAPLCHRRLRS